MHADDFSDKVQNVDAAGVHFFQEWSGANPSAQFTDSFGLTGQGFVLVTFEPAEIQSAPANGKLVKKRHSLSSTRMLLPYQACLPKRAEPPLRSEHVKASVNQRYDTHDALSRVVLPSIALQVGNVFRCPADMAEKKPPAGEAVKGSTCYLAEAWAESGAGSTFMAKS